ncbi:hypothetical protein [Methylorubrum extorquens]
MAIGYGNWLIVLTKVGDDEWSAMVYGPGGAIGGRFDAPSGGSSLLSVLEEAKGFIGKQPQPQQKLSAPQEGDHWTITLAGTKDGWRAVVTNLSDPPGVYVTIEGPTHEAAIDEAGEHIESAYSSAPGMG